MQYSIKRWPKKDDGILFFFQRLEEMLFHYSSDIVRRPVHNSRTLMQEYLANESDCVRGKVKSYQLDQILSELKYSLQCDSILRENFGTDFVDGIVKEISVLCGDMVRYIHNKLPQKVYLKWCAEYIKKHAEMPEHKDEIEHGLRTWIVEVLSLGYTPEYIYHFLHTHLKSCNGEAKTTLADFIAHFTLEHSEYRVYLVFTPYMYECKDILSKRLPIHFEDDGYFDKIRLRKNDFLGYIDEKSTDRYSAAKTAYSRVAEFLKFYRVLSNRKKEFVRKNGYVKELGLDRLWVISTLPNGYKSIEAEPAINISYAADNVILSCQGKPRETRIHISKLIDLHNQALRQYDLCDGFLNLWSILEVVCSELSGESKIEKVINGIVPTLKKDYLHELIGNIQQDLSDNLEKVKYESLISKITDKYPKLNPVWCMIFLPEFDELLDELFHNELEHYPVIRNKIYRLYILREHKSEVKCLYDKYAQRIKWHIYRLYRARNAIVHSGETPPHIQSLGEHLHIYADRLLLEILFKLSFEPTLKTVSDILIDTRLKLNQVMTQFESKEAVSEADISCVTDSFYYVTRR